jgi:protoporphyrinogen oxidase
MSPTRQRWGIVGGGLLGMTIAHHLARRGEDVTLYEAADSVGGLASPWSLGDVVWDRHYHVTLLSDTHLRSLLAELDLEKEMRWVETRTGFYTDGQLYSISNTLEFLRFPPLRLIDKLRLAATILYASRLRDWRKLETIPVVAWLRRWSGARCVERLWLPLLRAKLGEHYTMTSAAFIWASIARLYAARRSGLKREMFGYVPGGYARILARFADLLAAENVRITLNHAATSVKPTGDHRVHVEFAHGRREIFDQVVVTTPAPVAARLCPQLTAAERSALAGIRYQGIICASLLLRQPLTPFYVTNIADASVPFTAVIGMSTIVDPQQLGGNALVYLPKYVAPDDPLLALADGAVEELFLGALSRIYPAFRRADLRCFRVSRARYVHAIPTLHYSTRLPPMTTSLPGIHIVTSAHIVNGTLNVNETVALAEDAAPRLLAAAAAVGGGSATAAAPSGAAVRARRS